MDRARIYNAMFLGTGALLKALTPRQRSEIKVQQTRVRDRLKAILDSHPAWIIASPEYNGSYTGLLKNTLDWASSPVKGHATWSDGNKPFGGKVIGLVSASPGALGGLRSLGHLQPLLLNLQAWVCPRQFALGHAGDAFDAQGHLASENHRKQAQAVIDQAVWAAGRFLG